MQEEFPDTTRTRGGAHTRIHAHAKGGGGVGRRRKYTPNQLFAAVRDYLRSISRTVNVTEPVDSGKRDSKGHVVYEYVEVRNDDGEYVSRKEYLVPLTITGLCRELDISRDTWARYAADERYADAVELARGAVQDYLERELLTRQKGLQGVIFALQANFGMSEKRVVELGPRAAAAVRGGKMTMEERAELIRSLTEIEGDGPEEAD